MGNGVDRRYSFPSSGYCEGIIENQAVSIFHHEDTKNTKKNIQLIQHIENFVIFVSSW